jgi:AAA domain
MSATDPLRTVWDALEQARNGNRPEVGDLHTTGVKPPWLRGDEMNPCAASLNPLPTVPGFPFMIPGTAALLSGPTGAGRSSFIQACAYDAAIAGLRVMYLGGEVTLGEFNTRAALLADKRGHDPEAVRERLGNVRYLELTETLETAWAHRKEWLAGVEELYDVVIVDPLGDALEAVQLEAWQDPGGQGARQAGHARLSGPAADDEAVGG